MYRIETAPLTFPPYQCMVTGREDGEMVVFDADILPMLEQDVPRLTIKRDIIEEVARGLGMAPASEVEALRAQVEEWGGQVSAALDSLSLAQEFEEQFSHNLPQEA